MKKRKVLYLEIAEQIKEEIQNGVYPVGTMLPTETELEERFEVSKITVRKAIEILADDGFVHKQSGKGTTVISNRLFNHLSKGASFSAILEKEGVKVSKKVIGISQETAPDALYTHLTTRIDRVYYYGEQPFIIFSHYLPKEVFDTAQETFDHQSLYTVLANHGFVPDRFEDAFDVTRPSLFQEKVLQVSKMHLLQRIRKSFDQRNNVIEYSVAIYNTAIHPYLIEFEI